MAEEGVGDGDAFPAGGVEGEGRAEPGKVVGAAQGEGEVGEEGFCIVEDVGGGGGGAVPLEEGELGAVDAAAFAGAEAGARLVDGMETGGEEALHRELGGGAEPAAGGGYGVDVVLGGVCGEPDGGADFEKAAGVEKTPHGTHEARAEARGAGGGRGVKAA